MRKSFLILILSGIVLVPVLTSCDENKVRMEVVRDCTGTYLRNKSGQDFKVCNEELIDSYSEGTKIKVSFDQLDTCFGLLENPQCELAHISEGNIEITKIY